MTPASPDARAAEAAQAMAPIMEMLHGMAQSVPASASTQDINELLADAAETIFTAASAARRAAYDAAECTYTELTDLSDALLAMRVQP